MIDLLDSLQIGNLQEGDCVKFMKNSNNNDLAYGTLLKMSGTGLTKMKINDDKQSINLAIMNTLIENIESETDISKKQLLLYIKSLQELYKQLV